jgi:riboflavin kinase/FMN adenylyltransferase
MRIAKSMDEIGFDPNTVVTVGAFDGVHLGHRAILRSLTETATESKCRSVVITFEPHPQSVMRPGTFRFLTTPKEKLSLLEESYPDEILVLPFTKAFSQIEPERFVEETLVQRIGLCEIILGTGHTFGKGKKGGQDVLKKMSARYGFKIEVVPPVFVEDQPVSSTRIRQMLDDGNVPGAKNLLGRWYSLSGVVTRGSGIGAKIGFPTANIAVDHPLKLIPKDGIYAVRVQLDEETHPGSCNVGFSPTLKGAIREIEVYIHDYSGEIYGHSIRIEFIARLRDEQKFERLDDLVATIEQDKQKTIDIVSHA